LDISKNCLNAEGTKLLAEALKSNQIMTALNISSNTMTCDGEEFGDMSGVAALADVMPGMGALLVLSLKDNSLGTEEGGKVISEMLKGNSVLRELDLSGNGVYPASENSPKFAVALSPGLADNRALTSLNLSSNGLKAEGAKIVAEAIQVIVMRLRSFWCHFHVHLTTS
jgi:hypothetical protein